MGNTLKCFRGEEDDGHLYGGRRRDRYPYYEPQYYSGGHPHPHPPAAAHQQGLAGPHGFVPLTTQAAGPNTGHQQWSSGVQDNRVVAASQYQSNEDIDESSAEGLCGAKSYAKANPLVIQVPVLGTSNKFWRLSDKATRITRKLALILRSHHAVGKHLAAPLQVSNVWIGGGGAAVVKLRGVSFTDEGFCVDRVRDDYRHLCTLLLAILRASSSMATTRLPPDYRDFLALLASDTLAMDDEFLIVNNAALLPMKNRKEAVLMLHERIVKHMGRTETGRAKKRRILAGLPYEGEWLETARANARIKQWVANVQHEYRGTPGGLLRLNRNVRSHLHEYGDDGGGIEEALYCEWPELLMAMAKLLHLEGELEGTDIQNKFG